MNDKILELIKRRLDIGAKKYQKENILSDGRDFELEALEELLDGCVYLASRLIELRNRRPYEWWKEEGSNHDE